MADSRADSSLTHNPRPPKFMRREPDWDNCLCHVRDVAHPSELTNFTPQSWSKLQDAAEARQDIVLDTLSRYWNVGPKGGYHRLCYQQYTNKTLISRLTPAKWAPLPVSPLADETPSENIISNTPNPTCIFCENKSKRAGGQRQQVYQCSTRDSIEKIRKAAIRRTDDKILSLIDDDKLMTLGYHKRCYLDYSRTTDICENSTQSTESQEAVYHTSQSSTPAFTKLTIYVRETIFEELDVLRMTDLRETYIDFLEESGIDAPDYRTEKLKKKLQRHFGDALTFWKPQNRSKTEIVYSSSTSTGHAFEAGIAAAAATVENPPRIDHTTDEVSEVFRSAQIIRAELQTVKNCMPWPPTPDNLTEDKVSVPDLVYNFLTWLICGDAEQGIISRDKLLISDSTSHRQVMSIAQDLIHRVSSGRVKTPKHIALPLTVKHLTRSVQLVTILNHFGHSLSNSVIQEVETAMAERNMTQLQAADIYVPTNIFPDVPVIMCWDNNDINEETLSGKGTTHCTNGILIQREIQTAVQHSSNCDSARTRKRSFKPTPRVVIPYNAGKRIGPGAMVITDEQLQNTEVHEAVRKARLVDMVWCMLRDNRQPQDIPGWTGFNATVTRNRPPLSIVGYCPVIEASPTELSTVYTLLKQSVEMGLKLNQDEITIVLDQAIYAKAQEILWKQTHEFENIVLRMGAFHITMTFLAVLGKRFGDAGLADLLIEADIVAAGSIPGVLEGRHYNRAMRAHKLVVEAIHRLRWSSFQEWMSENGQGAQENDAVLEKVNNACTSPEQFEGLLLLPELAGLLVAFQEFCGTDRGQLASFWDSYIEMVFLLLRFVRATKEGDWDLHMCSVREMLPWVFAYDRSNYARYLSVYWAEMTLLPTTHPQIHAQLMQGEFAVQRSRHGLYSQIPVDQTIEQTINRDSKTKGGIIGISLNRGAVQRWIVTAHDRARVMQACREMAGLSDGETSLSHKETTKPRIRKDELDILRIVDTLKNWNDPFGSRDPTEPLVNIASGLKATPEILDDLSSAKENGRIAFEAFVHKRLVTSETDIFAPLTKNKLKSFSSMVKTQRHKTSTSDVVVKADRGLFARMVVLAQHRQMDMREVLTFPLGPLPWSLSYPDGTPTKTMKASLLHILEAVSGPTDDVPPSAVWIIDGMALLQTLKSLPRTFSDLARYVLQTIKALSRHTNFRVDLVMDQYPDVSIKATERSKRATSGTLQVQINAGSQNCPTQWKKFLSDGRNKMGLVEFFFNEWQTPGYTEMFQGFGPLYMTHGDECHKLMYSEDMVDCTRVEELCTIQEEADTRMLLHARHAALAGNDCVIIKSPDTDVAVLACSLGNQIPARILFFTGTQQRQRYIDTTAIGEALGPNICEAIIGLHAFTGCDSTSAFVGKGKKQGYDLVVSDAEMCDAMKVLGESFQVHDNVQETCERFVCSLYGQKGSDVHSVRYKLFCSRNTQTSHLPPTKYALQYHVKRANYQACIWRNSLLADAAIPSPHGHGWNVEDGHITIHWMDQKPAPNALLNMVSCNCQKSCVASRCSCRKHAMPCTDVCGCEECSNTQRVPDTDDQSDDEIVG